MFDWIRRLLGWPAGHAGQAEARQPTVVSQPRAAGAAAAGRLPQSAPAVSMPPNPLWRPAADKPVPGWLTPPLPLNADFDAALAARIDAQLEELPDTLWGLIQLLQSVNDTPKYDPLVQRANRVVWQVRHELLASARPEIRQQFAWYAQAHLPPEGQRFVFRRLAKDPHRSVRRLATAALARGRLLEVALPATRSGSWDPAGWQRGIHEDDEHQPHRAGRRIQERNGLPPLETVRQLRDLLQIRSSRQLGYLLLATDANGGPYRRFEIAKRSGGTREICAPGPSLRFVQRRILDMILSRVPTHPAAHGFVRGRSTVTGAAPHVGAALILKFDLEDFFPTIHGFRVIGLFASLGYEMDNGRFSTRDESRQIAPCLARLCSYTPDPTQFGLGWVPQGAPTSPALSNLICRGLDARLHGLALAHGGSYTRYADDLTFSFPSDLVHVGRFRWWVNQICQQEGFHVHEGKFRVLRPSQRQIVTGIVVNQQLNVPRRLRRRLRAILHNCRVHGPASQARGRDGLESWLRGQASYLQMVRPDQGRALLAEIDAIFSQ